VVLGGTALMLALAALIWAGVMTPADEALRAYLHSLASPEATAWWLVVTYFGSWPFLVPVNLGLAIGFGVRHQLSTAGRIVTATLGAEIADELLKLVFHRPRPLGFFSFVQPQTLSYPSGHAMVSAAFFGALALVIAEHIASRAGRRLVWAASACAVLMIGYSRVYLGVHYPSDVVGGWAGGAVILALSEWLWRRRQFAG
jgi:undecaprenyl-diphosphatase